MGDSDKQNSGKVPIRIHCYTAEGRWITSIDAMCNWPHYLQAEDPSEGRHEGHSGVYGIAIQVPGGFRLESVTQRFGDGRETKQFDRADSPTANIERTLDAHTVETHRASTPIARGDDKARSGRERGKDIDWPVDWPIPNAQSIS